MAQVHEHAAFNGLRATIQFHGPEVIRYAIDGAGALGQPRMQEMLLAALARRPKWRRLEEQWHREADFQIESFIEAHAEDFFVAET